VLEPITPTTDSGPPSWLIVAIAIGAVALIVVGAWRGLRRQRA
jgi:MYXO-CTERM domain-containing protein